VEPGLIGSLLSSRKDENALVNGRFLGNGTLCVERSRRLVRSSALTLDSGRLILATSALAG